jgi:c-di-AMP phosphodiesterase-like protein
VAPNAVNPFHAAFLSVLAWRIWLGVSVTMDGAPMAAIVVLLAIVMIPIIHAAQERAIQNKERQQQSLSYEFL